MSSFKKLSKSDVTVVPYHANKQWTLNYCPYPTSSDYLTIYTGTNVTGAFSLDNDPVTENEYERLIYTQINQLFYQSYSASLDTRSLMFSPNNYASASQQRPTSSYFIYNDSDNLIQNFPTGAMEGIRVLSVNQNIYGNKVLPNYFILSSSAYYVTDDGYGNLYDTKSTKTHIGNIYYAQGLAIITNQDYQYMFPQPPIAKNDTGSFLTTDVPKVISASFNDYARSGTLNGSTIAFSGSFSGAGYSFATASNGTIVLTTAVAGTYTVYYTIGADIAGSCATNLRSNVAKVVVNVTEPTTTTTTTTSTTTTTTTPTTTSTTTTTTTAPTTTTTTTSTTTTTTTTPPSSSVHFYWENYDNNTNINDSASYFLGGQLIVDSITYYSTNFFINSGSGDRGAGLWQLVTGSISKASGSTLTLQDTYLSSSSNVWNTATSASLILQVRENNTLIYNLSQSVYPTSSTTDISQNVVIGSGKVYDVYGSIKNLYVPPTTTTTTSTTTTTTTSGLIQLDWVTGPKGAGAGQLEIRDYNNNLLLNETTIPLTKSGSLFLSSSQLPYSVTGSWSAGSGNIVRYSICDITNGGEIFASGDIDNVTGSVSYQVYPTPLHTRVWLTSGASSYPPTCPIP